MAVATKAAAFALLLRYTGEAIAADRATTGSRCSRCWRS